MCVILASCPSAQRTAQEAYQAAVDEGTYPHGCYIIVNEHEYFATGVPLCVSELTEALRQCFKPICLHFKRQSDSL